MYTIIKEPHPELEYKLGWAPPATPDPRNYRLDFDPAAAAPPPKASVLAQLPSCWNQGQLGSCTSFGTNATRWQIIQKEFEAKSPGISAPELMSFLFEYWNTRADQGTTDYDSGGSVQGAFKAMSKYGVCPDKDWPYDISQYKVKPPDIAFADGLKHKFLQYFDIGSSLNNLKACIAAGYSFAFGFTVKSSFVDKNKGPAHDGIMRKPGFFERTLGGHCVAAVEYDDSFVTHEKHPGAVLIRNSWGTSWGPLGGYFYMPYNCIDSDLADEFFSPRLAQ